MMSRCERAQPLMKIVVSDTPPYYLNLDAPTLPAEPVTGDNLTKVMLKRTA